MHSGSGSAATSLWQQSRDERVWRPVLAPHTLRTGVAGHAGEQVGQTEATGRRAGPLVLPGLWCNHAPQLSGACKRQVPKLGIQPNILSDGGDASRTRQPTGPRPPRNAAPHYVLLDDIEGTPEILTCV